MFYWSVLQRTNPGYWYIPSAAKPSHWTLNFRLCIFLVLECPFDSLKKKKNIQSLGGISSFLSPTLSIFPSISLTLLINHSSLEILDADSNVWIILEPAPTNLGFASLDSRHMVLPFWGSSPFSLYGGKWVWKNLLGFHVTLLPTRESFPLLSARK